MAISFHNALGLYENALKLRSDRASVLSSNLANADTPNYKAKDVDFHAELSRRMNTIEMSKGKLEGAPSDFTKMNYLYRTPTQPSIDGNTVEEQVEHAEYMKNSLEFQTAFTILNGKFKGLTKALKGE